MLRTMWVAGLAAFAIAAFAGGTANAQTYNETGSQKVVNNTVVRDVAGTVAATLGGHLNAISGGNGFGAPGVAVSRADMAGRTGRSGAMNPRGFGFWVNGGYTSLSNDFTATAYDGDVVAGMVGVDYRLGDRFTLGVAGGYENTDLDTSFNAGTFQSDGYSVTPYAVFRIDRHFAVNGSFSYTWLSTDIARGSGATTGTYDSTRKTAAVNILGNWSSGKWRFGALLGYMYINQDDDAYNETGTGAGFVPSASTEIGQGRVGARIGYDLGKVETYFSGRYEYDFTSPGSQTLVTTGGTVSTPNDRSGFTLAAGLRFSLAPNVTGGIEGSTTQGRDNQDIYGVNGTLRFTF